MTKQDDGVEIGVLTLVLTFFALGVLLGWITWGIDRPQYDTDCLDELANKICIEEGYYSGKAYSGKTYDMFCFEKRKSTSDVGFNWLEGEKEQCLK